MAFAQYSNSRLSSPDPLNSDSEQAPSFAISRRAASTSHFQRNRQHTSLSLPSTELDKPFGTSSPSVLRQSQRSTAHLGRRKTQSQKSIASSHAASRDRTSSPRKQTFELDIGRSKSPQKLRVTVEANNDFGAEALRRRLFESSSPEQLSSPPRIMAPSTRSTVRVPLKGEDEVTKKKTGTPRRPRGGSVNEEEEESMPATIKSTRQRNVTSARQSTRTGRHHADHEVLISDLASNTPDDFDLGETPLPVVSKSKSNSSRRSTRTRNSPTKRNTTAYHTTTTKVPVFGGDSDAESLNSFTLPSAKKSMRSIRPQPTPTDSGSDGPTVNVTTTLVPVVDTPATKKGDQPRRPTPARRTKATPKKAAAQSFSDLFLESTPDLQTPAAKRKQQTASPMPQIEEKEPSSPEPQNTEPQEPPDNQQEEDGDMWLDNLWDDSEATFRKSTATIRGESRLVRSTARHQQTPGSENPVGIVGEFDNHDENQHEHDHHGQVEEAEERHSNAPNDETDEYAALYEQSYLASDDNRESEKDVEPPPQDELDATRLSLPENRNHNVPTPNPNKSVSRLLSDVFQFGQTPAGSPPGKSTFQSPAELMSETMSESSHMRHDEDFSMIFPDSIHIDTSLPLISPKDFGRTTNLAINRTLEAMRRDREHIENGRLQGSKTPGWLDTVTEEAEGESQLPKLPSTTSCTASPMLRFGNSPLLKSATKNAAAAALASRTVGLQPIQFSSPNPNRTPLSRRPPSLVQQALTRSAFKTTTTPSPVESTTPKSLLSAAPKRIGRKSLEAQASPEQETAQTGESKEPTTPSLLSVGPKRYSRRSLEARAQAEAEKAAEEARKEAEVMEREDARTAEKEAKRQEARTREENEYDNSLSKPSKSYLDPVVPGNDEDDRVLELTMPAVPSGERMSRSNPLVHYPLEGRSRIIGSAPTETKEEVQEEYVDGEPQEQYDEEHQDAYGNGQEYHEEPEFVEEEDQEYRQEQYEAQGEDKEYGDEAYYEEPHAGEYEHEYYEEAAHAEEAHAEEYEAVNYKEEQYEGDGQEEQYEDKEHYEGEGEGEQAAEAGYEEEEPVDADPKAELREYYGSGYVPASERQTTYLRSRPYQEEVITISSDASSDLNEESNSTAVAQEPLTVSYPQLPQIPEAHVPAQNTEEETSTHDVMQDEPFLEPHHLSTIMEATEISFTPQDPTPEAPADEPRMLPLVSPTVMQAGRALQSVISDKKPSPAKSVLGSPFQSSPLANRKAAVPVEVYPLKPPSINTGQRPQSSTPDPIRSFTAAIPDPTSPLLSNKDDCIFKLGNSFNNSRNKAAVFCRLGGRVRHVDSLSPAGSTPNRAAAVPILAAEEEHIADVSWTTDPSRSVQKPALGPPSPIKQTFAPAVTSRLAASMQTADDDEEEDLWAVEADREPAAPSGTDAFAKSQARVPDASKGHNKRSLFSSDGPAADEQEQIHKRFVARNDCHYSADQSADAGGQVNKATPADAGSGACQSPSTADSSVRVTGSGRLGSSLGSGSSSGQARGSISSSAAQLKAPKEQGSYAGVAGTTGSTANDRESLSLFRPLIGQRQGRPMNQGITAQGGASTTSPELNEFGSTSGTTHGIIGTKGTKTAFFRQRLEQRQDPAGKEKDPEQTQIPNIVNNTTASGTAAASRFLPSLPGSASRSRIDLSTFFSSPLSLPFYSARKAASAVAAAASRRIYPGAAAAVNTTTAAEITTNDDSRDNQEDTQYYEYENSVAPGAASSSVAADTPSRGNKTSFATSSMFPPLPKRRTQQSKRNRAPPARISVTNQSELLESSHTHDKVPRRYNKDLPSEPSLLREDTFFNHSMAHTIDQSHLLSDNEHSEDFVNEYHLIAKSIETADSEESQKPQEPTDPVDYAPSDVANVSDNSDDEADDTPENHHHDIGRNSNGPATPTQISFIEAANRNSSTCSHLKSKEDITRWTEETSKMMETSPKDMRPLPRVGYPFPRSIPDAPTSTPRPTPSHREMSPGKSCIRSPLKGRTPGRVVEFNSSALSPMEQRALREQKRQSREPEQVEKEEEDDEEEDSLEEFERRALEGARRERESSLASTTTPGTEQRTLRRSTRKSVGIEPPVTLRPPAGGFVHQPIEADASEETDPSYSDDGESASSLDSEEGDVDMSDRDEAREVPQESTPAVPTAASKAILGPLPKPFRITDIFTPLAPRVAPPAVKPTPEQKAAAPYHYHSDPPVAPSTPTRAPATLLSPASTVNSSPTVILPKRMNLSPSVWTADHWQHLKYLVLIRRSRLFYFNASYPRPSVKAKIVGEEIAGAGQRLVISQEHADAIDAFLSDVPGWDVRDVAKRVFAVVKAEEMRQKEWLEEQQRILSGQTFSMPRVGLKRKAEGDLRGEEDGDDDGYSRRKKVVKWVKNWVSFLS